MSKKAPDKATPEAPQKTKPGVSKAMENPELHVIPIAKPAVTRKVPKGTMPKVTEQGFFNGRIHSSTEAKKVHLLKRSAPTKEDRDRAVQDLTDRGMKLPRGLQTAMDRHFSKDGK